jgi:hypothetical protein
LVAALTFVTVLAVADSASAAPNGVKTNQTLCSPMSFGTVCTDFNYVDTTTTTPSGNVSYTRNGTATTTITFTSGPNAGCTFTGASDFRHHLLLRPGETEFDFPEVQVIADKTEASLTRECPTVTKFCGTIAHTHRVGPDYDFQFDRLEIIGDCGP